MLLNEIFGWAERKAEKKREATLQRVRAKEKQKIIDKKKAEQTVAQQAELAREIAAGDARRAKAAAKNTQRRELNA